jgi:endogenous inhibitor of DNA gyrase (YacG/DUF329 family)
MSNTTELRCLICGNIINPHSKRKRYCSAKCAAIGNSQNAEKNRQLIKEKRTEAAAKKSKLKLSSLDKTLKALNDYNKQHGTNLSYGRFVQMKGL